MIHHTTAAETHAVIPLCKPKRYRLRLPFRLRSLGFASVLVHSSTTSEVAERMARVTPSGLCEADLLHHVNVSDIDALQEISGIGAVLACQILKTRERDGLFTESDQLALVIGLGASRFHKLFGRPSVAADEHLRLFLRLPANRDLTPSDFQPFALQLLPIGLKRAMFIPSGGPVKMEKNIAKVQDSKLCVRSIAGWSLCLHLEPSSKKSDHLVYFLKNLSVALRSAVVNGGYLKPAGMKIAESRTPFRREPISGLSNSVSIT